MFYFEIYEMLGAFSGILIEQKYACVNSHLSRSKRYPAKRDLMHISVGRWSYEGNGDGLEMEHMWLKGSN